MKKIVYEQVAYDYPEKDDLYELHLPNGHSIDTASLEVYNFMHPIFRRIEIDENAQLLVDGFYDDPQPSFDEWNW